MMDNVIVFGVGTQGTRLFVSILENIGWSVGSTTKTMEYHWAQNINKQLLIEDDICPCGNSLYGYPICTKCDQDVEKFVRSPLDVEQCLDNLDTPWVIKDPRFVLTLHYQPWDDVWDKYKPCMLYVSRDYNTLVEKYKRKWTNLYDIYGCSLKELVMLAESRYLSWPYNKIHITFE